MQQVQNDNETERKLAFPWLCIACEGFNRGEPAHRGAWGRLCWKCWMLGAEAEEEKGKENTSLDLEHNTVT